MCVLFLSAGVDYEYKVVNLLKGEQSDPGVFSLKAGCNKVMLMQGLVWKVANRLIFMRSRIRQA